MKIEKNSVVTMAYVLTDNQGEQLDSSKEHGPMVYLHGHNQLIEGLELKLEGSETGKKLNIELSAEEAYGNRHEELLQEVQKSEFEGVDIEVGMHFQTEVEDGEMAEFEVVEVRDESVILDGNHPLAGRTLVFNIEIMEVRQATEEELDHGHAHGPEGHSH